MLLFMHSLDSDDTEIIKVSNHFCVTSIYIFSLMGAELIWEFWDVLFHFHQD